MLQIKNVSKIYKSKNAAPVRALDDVSVNFPDTGMVFLLGKSGSGKSTMLNVIGGLDAFDKGEIIIKGKSSKSFKEKDFDSYRNTFIGFIFQEYNILEEFSVEKNIALALELQGKNADRKSVNAILEQVDLQGYGKRKPNQLSGGQKQRVAIARALIKDPEIIMADEPTGALDSTTGRQVFDTLKKLSETRLIIVVSHDRDFAENYADRIIEMKDGKILNDTSKRKSPIQHVSDSVIASGKTILVKPGHKVTAQEKAFIDRALELNEHGVIISVDQEVNQNFKKFAKMDSNGNREYFDNTKNDEIKLTTDKNFKMIRSRFKYWDSFKMGASGLKLKKVRLFFTVLLAAVALTFFGVADTAGSFNASRSMYESIVASGDTTVTVAKQQVEQYNDGYYTRNSIKSDNSDITFLENKFQGYNFTKAYELNNVNLSLPSSGSGDRDNMFFYTYDYSGFVIPEADFAKYGLSITGNYPTAVKQAMITDYQFELFKIKSNNTITNLAGLTGHTFTVNGEDGYTITGIVDTKFDFSRYQHLKSVTSGSNSDWMLYMEMQEVLRFGFSNGIFFSNSHSPFQNAGVSGNAYDGYTSYDSVNGRRPGTIVDSSAVAAGDITFFSSGKTSLQKNEILVSEGSWNWITSETPYKIYFRTWSGNENAVDYTVVGTVGGASDTLYNTASYYGGDIALYFRHEDIVGNSSLRTAMAPYKALITTLKGSRSSDFELINFISDFTAKEDGYIVRNQFSSLFEMAASTVESIAGIFIYIGIGFAVFASLMMMSFITMTINHKKREIGILRAIGAKKFDVFKIFLNESLIMSVVNFILATVLTIVAVILLNSAIGGGIGMSIVLLSFGLRQVLLIAGISILVAIVASALPVRKISRLKPIDAIQNRK